MLVCELARNDSCCRKIKRSDICHSAPIIVYGYNLTAAAKYTP